MDAPVFYVHWIEYPCLKGVFYETSNQVQEYIKTKREEFSRELREGDNEKAPKSIYLKKMYSPLLNMGDFDSFVKTLESLIHN